MQVLKITNDLGKDFVTEVEKNEVYPVRRITPTPMAEQSPNAFGLRKLSDDELLNQTKFLAAEERRITGELLAHLREVEARRLYAREGFSSLFEYVHRGLGFSEGSAGRRIGAMRLIKNLPEAATALAEGRVSLSNASALQHFLKREKKTRAKEYSKSEQAVLLSQLEHRSSRECEKVLVAISPASALPQERERVVTATDTELKFVASDRLMKKLSKLKSLWSHRLPNPCYAELFERLVDRELERIDPEKRALRQQKCAEQNQARRSVDDKDVETGLKKGTQTNSETTPETVFEADPEITSETASKKRLSSTPAPECQDEKADEARTSMPLRYIPASLRRAVWLRDRGECQHRDPKTGRRCCSQYQLQYDHITPFAQGGETTFENLQLVCRAHNTWRAMEKLGPQFMAQYLGR